MKLTRQKSKKKLILIASIIVVIAALGAVTTAYFFKIGPFATSTENTINFGPPTQEEKDAGTDTKQRSIDQADDGKSQGGSDPTPDPKPIEGSDKSSIQTEITAANQDASHLRVRVLVQTVTNTGTCTITMDGPNQKKYSASAGIQPLSSNSTCQGFDIPLSDLSSGNWNIHVEFQNSTLIGFANKKVEIK